MVRRSRRNGGNQLARTRISTIAQSRPLSQPKVAPKPRSIIDHSCVTGQSLMQLDSTLRFGREEGTIFVTLLLKTLDVLDRWVRGELS